MTVRHARIVAYLVALLAFDCACMATEGEQATTEHFNAAVDANGTVHVPSINVPYSVWQSPEAKAAFLDRARHPLPWTEGDIGKTRRDIAEQFHKPLLEKLNRQFSVSITTQVIAGVHTDVVMPNAGVTPGNATRVLLNLHGGGFMVAARTGGEVESIPIAAVGKIKVITIDYREAPEYKFPAGSEDVTAVYRELLKTYKPHDIGIYGCSAGGLLTAEVMAWLQARHLPMPGAIGIFGAGATAEGGGDSSYLGPLLSGGSLTLPVPPLRPTDYFFGADLLDPLVSPIHSVAILRKFPPTLVISGTRDPAMSAALYTHTQLVKAGVDADLHVWEGAAHCFFFQPDPPESHEAWQVIAGFFDRHLGH